MASLTSNLRLSKPSQNLSQLHLFLVKISPSILNMLYGESHNPVLPVKTKSNILYISCETYSKCTVGLYSILFPVLLLYIPIIIIYIILLLLFLKILYVLYALFYFLTFLAFLRVGGCGYARTCTVCSKIPYSLTILKTYALYRACTCCTAA